MDCCYDILFLLVFESTLIIFIRAQDLPTQVLLFVLFFLQNQRMIAEVSFQYGEVVFPLEILVLFVSISLTQT